MPPILAKRLANRVDAVIGVDTHTDTHTAAVLTPAGTVVAEFTVAATADGAATLLRGRSADQRTRIWPAGLGSGQRPLTRCRAAARSARRARVHLEAPTPATASRRRGGKFDALHAVHAASAVLAAGHLATPRIDGDRGALRILHVSRRHYSDTRTATVNLFKSLILTADDDLARAVPR